MGCTILLLILLMFMLVQYTPAVSSHDCDIRFRFNHVSHNRTLVDCRSKHLHAIPTNLPLDTSVADISSNDIREIHSNQFQYLGHLITLRIRKCNLSTLHQNAFNGLGQLEILDLSSNRLRDLPVAIFTNMKSLKIINLSYNGNMFGSSLSSSFFTGLHCLNQISLTGLGLESIARDVFTTNINLRLIRLSFNKFKQIPDAIFAVRGIRLSHNQIRSAHVNITPSIHRRLKLSLDLSFNHITELSRADFKPLAIYYRLYLNINNNRITRIHEDAFADVKDINIAISFNPVCKIRQSVQRDGPSSCTAFRNLTFSLRKSKIYRLTARRIGLYFDLLPPETFLHLRYTPLKILDLGRNHLGRLNSSAFQYLPHLTELSFDFCELLTFPLKVLQFFRKNIKKINLDSNSLTTRTFTGILRQCPSLTEFSFSNNFEPSFAVLHQFSFYVENYQKIETLAFRPNKPQEIDDLTFRNLTSLKRLTVRGLHAKRSFNLKKLRLENLPHLNYLDLSGNKAYLHCESQCDAYFRGTQNVQILNMGTNRLYVSHSSTLRVMFSFLKKLTRLTLIYNQLSELPVGMFDSMHNLRKLYLSHNKIRTIFPGLFENLNQLEELYLDSNDITSIQDGAFDGLASLGKFVFIGNKLACGCHIRWFQNWLRKQTTVMNEGECVLASDSKRVKITEFRQSWLDCDNNLTKVSVSAIVALIVIASILYYARWDIKFALVTKCRWRCCAKKHQEGDVNLVKTFDAFVSYSLLDTAWVATELIPNLENPGDMNFRLCVHERNFLPGNSIVDSVEAAMDQSNHVIFWITQNFLESEVCDFELGLAKTKLFDGSINSAIFIFEKDFKKRQLPQPMGVMLRHSLCLHWHKVRLRRRDILWKRLKLTLMGNRIQED